MAEKAVVEFVNCEWVQHPDPVRYNPDRPHLRITFLVNGKSQSFIAGPDHWFWAWRFYGYYLEQGSTQVMEHEGKRYMRVPDAIDGYELG